MSAVCGYENIGHGGFPATDHIDKISRHSELCQPLQTKPAFIVIAEFAGISYLSAQSGNTAGCRPSLTAAFGQSKFQGHLLVLFRELIDNGNIIQTTSSDHQYIYIFHIHYSNGSKNIAAKK